ncbi:hypothetical protein ANCCAN_14925 [Ancylostoma caninum]|uniref:Uncharacterized protein n=1 Tax=Ancylostoma caninum TaxID=29170 RepID=A0A368G626_ANCCA|nr:hypothetical protein ANCCAN_14925 [Ancylostoma caninum]
MSTNQKSTDSRESAEMRSVKDEDHDQGSESGEPQNGAASERRESTEHEPKETCGSVARFARRELDYIAEMYVNNYEVFHRSSLGGGRAKEAVAMKRKLLQQMAEHLSGIVDEKRTVMQIDQKIRDEIRQVKKYFRYKRQDMMGAAGYSREIRLSASQQYIADKLRAKPRLPGFFDDPELRPIEGFPNDFGIDYTPGCSATEYCASLTFPADTTSFAEQNSLSLEASLCGLGDQHRAKTHDVNRTDTLDELQREALRAEIECSRARADAASEERKYWEEKRNLLALERRLLQQNRTDGELSRDRVAGAVEERLYWEERRRSLALKRQCMLDQMD